MEVGLAATEHSSQPGCGRWPVSLLNAVILQWPQRIAVSWQWLCPKRRELRYLITKLRVFSSPVASDEKQVPPLRLEPSVGMTHLRRRFEHSR